MTPLMKRAGLLALAALALSACEYGLGLSPDPTAKGQTVTVTNEGGHLCMVDEEVPGESDVVVFVVTSLVDAASSFAALMGGDETALDELGVVETTSDDGGVFAAQVTAPSIPGQHLVVAVCNASTDIEIPELEELRVGTAALRDDVDPESLAMFLQALILSDDVIVDLLDVAQGPLTVSLDKTEVEAGKQVVATFDRCQDHNDFDLPSIMAGEGMGPTEAGSEEPTPEEISTDHPDLDVFVDDVLVTTIAGTERYPTGTVDVPLTLTEVGEHEITGVCRFQTFEMLLEDLSVEVGLSSVQPQALEYPFPADGEGPVPFQWNEDVLTAAATVDVVAASVGAGAVNPPAAAPVVVAPRYTG